MEKLVIRNSSGTKIRKVLGAFTILIGIVWFIVFLDSRRIFDLLQFVLWGVLGAYHFTEGFGLEKEFIDITENGLIIKINSKIRSVIINDSEIENICLKRSEIVINRTKKNPVKFKRNYLELKQMTEIYEFFIAYSKLKNLNLIRDF